MAGLEGLLAGRVLGGRYLIEEVIGRGGMGAVYRALDERLGRRVAVKVITLVGGDPDAVERLRARFHREARAAAALPHHPNVVPVYDYGTDEDLGLDYIVMELLRGQDLATRMARSGAPPLSTALRILLQAVRGVAVGHRSGLIHRDVKPGNIFLTQGDEREVQVRVVDFGIAKLVDDDDTANQLTQDGRVPHSPAFASPEQLRGLSRLTPASDVFSLGAVGYLLLTGERPFTDADRNRMSLGMPVPPPRMRTSHPAIPAAVEVVIQKALAYDPADRFPDAVAMLEALEDAIQGIATTPLDPYAGVRYDRPLSEPTVAGQRRPEGLEGDEDRTRLLAEQGDRTRLLPEEDDRTRLLPERDEATLAEPATPPTGTPSPPPPTTAPRRQGPRAFTPRKPPKKRSRVGLVVWTLVLLALAAVAYWAYLEANRRVAEIPPPPEEIRGIGEPVDVEPPPERDMLNAVLLNSDGRRQYDAGHYDSALVSFRLAVEVDPENANYRRNLALALLSQGQNEDETTQLRMAEEAVGHLERALALDPTLEIAQYDYARALLVTGDTAQALEEFRTFANRVANASNPDLAATYLAAQNAITRIRTAQLSAARAAQRAQQDTAPPPLPVPDTIAPVVPAEPDG